MLVGNDYIYLCMWTKTVFINFALKELLKFWKVNRNTQLIGS